MAPPLTDGDEAEAFQRADDVGPRDMREFPHVRSLAGHWVATPYGGKMVLDWPEVPVARR